MIAQRAESAAADLQTAGGSAVSGGFQQSRQLRVCFIYCCGIKAAGLRKINISGKSGI